MDQLRLVMTKACNRSCPGCCNNYWDLEGLPQVNGYKGYKIVMITGGEPLIDQPKLYSLIESIRKTKALIYVYTAWNENHNDILDLLKEVDGITLTLHEPEDVDPFSKLNELLGENEKSLRLNVFRGVDISHIDTSKWIVKDDMEWDKDCPLPDGEEIKRLW